MGARGPEPLCIRCSPTKNIIGNNVYHRTSFKLKLKHVVNPQEKWIRADGIFEGIVEPSLFHTAQGIILARSRKLSDDEMLEKLRGVLKQARAHQRNVDRRNRATFLPARRSGTRFGSLVSAYRLIGYDPGIDYGFIEINRKLREEHPKIVASVIRQIEGLGATMTPGREDPVASPQQRTARVHRALPPLYNRLRFIAVGGEVG